jgi:replication-associated recombination protein RarA
MPLTDTITAREPLPPRIIIYGSAGIGKTTFAPQALTPAFNLLDDVQGAKETTKEK